MGKHYIGHLSYDGSKYYGWQKQPELPSIQETIFNAIRELYPLGRIDVKATSRTDKGVHALAQVVKFLAPRKEDPDELRGNLNAALPKAIQFTQLERINKSFKISYLPLFKEYLYFFCPHNSEQNYSFVGHNNKEKSLNIEIMKEGAELFTGIHSFKNFQYKSDSLGGFEREIYLSRIVKAHEIFPEAFKIEDPIYIFHIKGKGFLKQMVRLIMGSLIHLGDGTVTCEDIKNALEGEEMGPRVGYIAPGSGLFLYHIEFPEVAVNDLKRHVVDKKLFLEQYPQFELWSEESGNKSFSLDIKD